MKFPIIKSQAMKKAYQKATRAARVDFPVLIYGETGAGKEIMARFIHDHSNRSDTGKFMTLNCAVIPDNLVESELFGYEKGAFTGATREKVGLFTMADHGTLFLDEISEMSPDMQNKLLRVLENGEFISLGSLKVQKSDFRLISATNADIKKIVPENRLRRDLFHRINVISIQIPPLRERCEAIPDLVQYFLEKSGYGNYQVSLDVMDLLLSYAWPGNIRELRNVVEASVAMMEDGEDTIQVRHLPVDRFSDSSMVSQSAVSLKKREKRYRRKMIEHAMKVHGGDYREVMKVLNVSKDLIYRALSRSTD